MQNLHKQIRLADFRSRLFAVLLDCLIFGILLMPLVNILKKILFKGMPPDMIISEAISNSPNKKETFIEIVNTPEVMNMLNSQAIIQSTIILVFVQIAFFLVMFMIFGIYKQSTPGKMIMLIKIVDAETFEPASKWQYIVRSIAYLISALPLFLGFFWAIFNRNGQTWHDKIAGTVVIKR